MQAMKHASERSTLALQTSTEDQNKGITGTKKRTAAYQKIKKRDPCSCLE